MDSRISVSQSVSSSSSSVVVDFVGRTVIDPDPVGLIVAVPVGMIVGISGFTISLIIIVIRSSRLCWENSNRS